MFAYASSSGIGVAMELVALDSHHRMSNVGFVLFAAVLTIFALPFLLFSVHLHHIPS
jgi:hypothetical protein